MSRAEPAALRGGLGPRVLNGMPGSWPDYNPPGLTIRGDRIRIRLFFKTFQNHALSIRKECSGLCVVSTKLINGSPFNVSA
jgi:hypothetical protein